MTDIADLRRRLREAATTPSISPVPKPADILTLLADHEAVVRERDEARGTITAAWNAFVGGELASDFADTERLIVEAGGTLAEQIVALTAQRDAAESEAAATRESVRGLEAALRPFANMLPDCQAPKDALQKRLQEWCHNARNALTPEPAHD